MTWDLGLGANLWMNGERGRERQEKEKEELHLGSHGPCGDVN